GHSICGVATTAVTVGFVVSSVHVTVRDTPVASTPQASAALQLRVCVRVQPLLVASLVDGVIVTLPQPPFAVADPSAASSASFVGLQPGVSVVPVAVSTGASPPTVHVTVRNIGVATLPQSSVAVQVRVFDRVQPLNPTSPSEASSVTLLQSTAL